MDPAIVRKTPLIEDPRRITVAIVGLGYWGPNLLRVLVEQPDVRVKWLCDLDRGRLSRLSSRYPTVAATTSFEDIIEDPEVDAVVIATPVFSHFELASRCLGAGKHAFVEKPLSASSEHARQLGVLADERALVLMCGHTFLFSPPVRMVKSYLQSGALGELFFITSSRVNLGLHQRDVSVIWDLAPHDFSILLYWLEEMPETVRALGRDSVVPGIPDVAFVTLRFPSGLIVNVELSWLAPSKLRRTVLVGKEKMIVYSDGSPEPIRIYDHGVVYEDPETFGQYHLSYRTGDILTPKLDTAEPLAVEIEDFIEQIRLGERRPGLMELAQGVVALTEAADRSLHSGGEEIATASTRAVRSLEFA